MKCILILSFCLAAALATPLSRELNVEPVMGGGRITNGQTARSGQFPYQVGLSMSVSPVASHWCGGSLISSTWILTAAHCTIGAKTTTIYLGSTAIRNAELTIVVKPGNVIIHSGYNPNNLRNDISLIRIDPIQFTSKIQPVKLPSKAQMYSTFVGEKVIASGWGRTSDNINGVAPTLQWALLEVVPNNLCTNTYGSSFGLPSVVCVATPNAVSTCNGDSGGPLVLESSNVQIGLTSFGAAVGCELGFPSAFTRVASYLDWIKTYTGISY